MIWFHSSV